MKHVDPFELVSCCDTFYVFFYEIIEEIDVVVGIDQTDILDFLF